MAFHLNARRDDNELFSTSIYEIDHELQVRLAYDIDEDWAEIVAKLPESYRPFI